MVQAFIDKTRPRCDPWLNHGNHSARANAPSSFAKKPAYIRNVMQHVSHRNSAEAAISKRQVRGIEHRVDLIAKEDLRRDQVGYIAFEESVPLSQFQVVSVAFL